jgi:hypothetical protein
MKDGSTFGILAETGQQLIGGSPWWYRSASLRTQEFGVRIALGSSKNALMGLALREASYPILGGLALGTIAALGTTRVIRSLLYETQAATHSQFQRV